MSQQGAQLIKDTVAGEVNRAIIDINENTIKSLTELKTEIALLKVLLEDIRAATSVKPKAKKTEAEVTAAAPETVDGGAVPAAAKKGAKKDNASAWFKSQYEENETLRAKIDAIPEVAKTIGEMADDLKRKKTDKSRYTAKANAINKHHAPIVQAEFAAFNSTPLAPADSP